MTYNSMTLMKDWDENNTVVYDEDERMNDDDELVLMLVNHR